MRTLVLDLPGLSNRLLDSLDPSSTPSWFTQLLAKGRSTIQPVVPSVTMPTQATFTTGKLPSEHGIIANGLAPFRNNDIRDHIDMTSYPEYRSNVSFWEQANELVQAPRAWEANGRRTAMLFVQSSIGAADVVITPKPHHAPDGTTKLNTWTNPQSLNQKLIEQLGDFPLHHYWGPIAGMPATQWIVASARLVWEWEDCDLNWVYIPHLDYDGQRLGPDDPAMTAQLTELLGILTPLVERALHDDARVVVLSEYGMTNVTRSCPLNLHLRKAGLLTATENNEMDYVNSHAFALCDHQVAHIYVKDEKTRDAVQSILTDLPEVDKIYTGDARAEIGLNHERSGDIIVISYTDAWFEYRWWEDWDTAPAFAYTVDIHRKPGYDPTELFFDPATKRVCADKPELVKGSHGALPKNQADWPVLIGLENTPALVPATDIASLV